MSTSLDIRQSQTRILQDQLNALSTVQMDSTLSSINNEVTAPGRLIATSTPNLVVSVGSGTVVNPNTLKNRVLPLLSNSVIPFTGGTITFPSTSGTITVSPGTNQSITIGANQFVAVLVQLDTTGNIDIAVGTAAGSLAAAIIPTGSSLNLSVGYIVVQSNGSSVIQNITNSMLYQFVGGGGSSGGGVFNPTIQQFLSGSGTYTTPANVNYIRVRMVGAGGGGGGSGNTGTGGTGGTGGITTFGTSLLIANGGNGGVQIGTTGGIGGTASLGSGPIGLALNGSTGNATTGIGMQFGVSGAGGSSPFQGAGAGTDNATGDSAISNTGSGAAGGGGDSTSTVIAASGGGSGGYVDAIITSPLSTYSYSIGTAGTAGTAGTSGNIGGTGGSGYIEVTEYYMNGAVGTATNVTGVVAIAHGGTGTNISPQAQYYISPSTLAVTANTQINYDTATYDTTGSVTTGASWKFTAPITGIYYVQFSQDNTATSSTRLYKNGSLYMSFGTTQGGTTTVGNGSTYINLLGGDFIDLRPDTTTTITGGTAPLIGYVSIGLISTA